MDGQADLRVTIVSPFYPLGEGDDAARAHVGGVEVALAESARALARRGIDVTVLSTARQPGEDIVDGVRHLRVRRLATLFRTPVSGAFLQPLDADVVHVPATYPLYSDLLLARAARRLPTVLDYHFEPEPTGPAMAAAAGAWRATLAPLMRRADLVLVKSDDYARAGGRLGWVRPDRLRVVPNGVDPRRFRPVPAHDGYVLCVGRLIPYKGVDMLVRAMAHVQKRMRAPLVVAGTGPLRAGLENLARELGVDARFLGYVPDAALPDLYARAAVTVLPSVNGQEAFGVTLLESMSCGTPVVASDLPGVRTVAALGGIVAPPGDPLALSRAVLDVLEGRAGVPTAAEIRARVVRDYSWDAVAAKLVAAYREAEALRCGS